MAAMSNQRILHLEARLEQMIEGAFAHLFGKRIRMHDLAIRLARAMEVNSRAINGNDPRLLVPNLYTLYVHPETHMALLDNQPDLCDVLDQYIVELVDASHFRLDHPPAVKFLADANLARSDVQVVAGFQGEKHPSTAIMQPIKVYSSDHVPVNPQLIVNEIILIPLEEAVINVGRNQENDVVIDDPYVSRHHLQIRLYRGAYVLFDVHSRSGTAINGVRVKERRLQSGDVIHIGRSQLVYLEDTRHENDTEQIDRVDW